MKKILHIVEAFGGGVFSFLVDLVNNTDENFEIVIAYSKRKQTPENFESYFKRDIRFIEIENFDRSINLKKDMKALWEIKQIIKNENPDIIHMHSSKAGFLGRFACNCRKRRMLYNPHGFSFLMQSTSKLKRLIYWLIEKVATIKKCTIIACSKGEYTEALKLSSNTIWINNGIDIENITENIAKNYNRENYGAIKVCTSGRIGYQKNPRFFNKIAESFPNIKFMWIGDGELKEELKSPNITITGWKSRKEVLELVNQNDVFILTSLWEGLPISLLEAMFLKKVCLVSDCIGNRDVIKNKVNGFIINEDNYEEIIKTLNIEECQQITKKAREDICKEYSINVMSKKYMKIYENI